MEEVSAAAVPYAWHLRGGSGGLREDGNIVDLSFQPAGKEELLALLDLLPAPSAIALDRDCTAIQTNRAFKELLGEPSRDGTRERVREHLLAAIEEDREIHDAQIDVPARDGRSMHLLGSAAPLRDATGEVTGAMATFVDVSEPRRLQAVHEATRLELDAARDEERRLAARLSYLAQAGQELSESLDLRAVLDTFGRILVPQFADCVALTILDEQGALTITSVHHKDREVLSELAAARERHNQTGPTKFPISERVMETGEGAIVDDLPAMMQHPGADDSYRDYIRTLSEDFNFRKAIVVPMKNRGSITGLFVAIGSEERRYNEDDLRLLEELGRRAASAIDNARLFERQRHVSETLQQALLPPRLPKHKQVSFDAVYEAGDDEALIGGDWYDAFELPDGRILTSIGDVTGRGVQAAAIMSKMRHSIKALGLYESDPSKLLNAADVILRASHPDAIVTALVGVLDLQSHAFRYATAGHPPPYLRRASGHVLQLPCHGLPLGLRTGEEPPPAEIELCKDDLILLYTDGLMESTHDLREGERRITTALEELREDAMREVAHSMRETVLFDGSRDDVAIIAMRVLELEAADCDTLALSFDASDAQIAHDCRRFFLAYLIALGAPGEDFSSAELVLGELIGNVVRHTAGRVRISVNWSGTHPMLCVSDAGEGFDLEAILPDDILSEAGRGLFLVDALTRDFSVERLAGGGTIARAVLRLERG